MVQQDEDLDWLRWICRSTLKAAFPAFRHAEIDVSFYPYIGLTHTIRRKGSGQWAIRISDHCRYAPRQVIEAIAMILGSRIMHRRPPRRFLETYELFRKDPGIEEVVHKRRQERGWKHFAGSEGKHHVPAQLYQEVNSRFFNNQVEIRKIGWGLRKGWRRLGHYDPVHHSITLSPALDSPKVPEFVVRYIVYHEMLHAVFEYGTTPGPRRHHPPEFRRAEKAYPDFARAKQFLKAHFGRKHEKIDG